MNREITCSKPARALGFRAEGRISLPILVSLLACLIPTTIGGLLSASEAGLRKVNEMYVPEQFQAGFSDMIDEYVH